jgi:polyisoprenoid-binding protein YceI
MTDTAIPGYLAGTWKTDRELSEIRFAVRMLMVSKVRGRFTGCDVTLVTGDDPLASSVSATIELASIDTGKGKRDDHLRSADFLAVQEHPTMSYRSTGIRPIAKGWDVDGELTLHGITRPVPLTVAASRFGPAANGDQRARFSATAQVNRGEFGIDRWAGGGAVIGNKVALTFEIAVVRQS